MNDEVTIESILMLWVIIIVFLCGLIIGAWLI